MRHLFVSLLFLACTGCFAQSTKENATDSLRYNPRQILPFIYKNNKFITYPRFFKTLKSCEHVQSELKAVKNDYFIYLGVMGAMLGASFVLSSNDETRGYYWVPFVAGMAFTIPFDIIHVRSRIKKAVDTYNAKCVY